MIRNILIGLLLIPLGICAQETGSELLEKAIAYHDPEGNWANFKGALRVTMQTPKSTDRVSDIHMNLPKELFSVAVTKDTTRYTYRIEKGECSITLNGTSDFSDEEAKKLRLTCDRAHMYKDYYTYLYGLPMKLTDPGTRMDPKVSTKKFKGKDYLVLKVTYEKEVGDDTWYFYFDPKTYAMEVYQFYHQESENDGEYILLEGIEEINGIKIPKIRKWYYNEGDKYLGTDVLN